MPLRQQPSLTFGIAISFSVAGSSFGIAPSPLQGGRRIADFSKRKNKFEISGRTFRRVLSDGSTQRADKFSVSWRLLLHDFGVLSGDSAQEADFSLDLDESFARHSGNPYCLVQCGERNRWRHFCSCGPATPSNFCFGGSGLVRFVCSSRARGILEFEVESGQLQ